MGRKKEKRHAKKGAHVYIKKDRKGQKRTVHTTPYHLVFSS